LTDCLFCKIENSKIVSENDFFIVVRDNYPVTELHTLIISKRHTASYFELDDSEKISLIKTLDKQKSLLLKNDSTIKGFNIGINDGVEAGQTIMHFHAHLIPRRTGDVQNPRGGVRGVIPEKQNYQNGDQ
jgi:diadenosine tetraphosphate (Ap4A) HIT family hydrolase